MELMCSWLLLLLLLLLLVSSIALKTLKGLRKTAKKLPPGPRGLPLIGNLHQLSSMPHRPLLRLSQKHGPLMFLRLGPIPTLVVSSADAVKSIFKTHDLIFSGRPTLGAAAKFSYNQSNVSFAPYGEGWRQARKICVVELLSPQRVRSFRAIREQEVATLIAAIAKRSTTPPSPVNLSEMALALSHNVICRAAFGDGNGGGEGVYGGERSWFHGVMRETQEVVAGFSPAEFFPAMGWVDWVAGRRGKIEKNCREADGFFERVIGEHLKKKKKKEEDEDREERDAGDVEEDETEDFVDVLLRLQGKAAQGSFPSSMNHVKGIIADMFFAATDTTAATIIWTMTELTRNPRVMSKLQQELRKLDGNNGKLCDGDVEHLEYLQLVVKESLRLHPPAPLLIPRETLEPCTIQGYDIPAKTRVLVNTAAVAGDPEAWTSPREFRPERFVGRGGGELKGQDFDYLPFGVGRRSCPGVEFAAVLVKLVLANLLRCFDWRLPEGMGIEDVDVEEAPGLTMHKKEPLCLVATPIFEEHGEAHHKYD